MYKKTLASSSYVSCCTNGCIDSAQFPAHNGEQPIGLLTPCSGFWIMRDRHFEC